MSRKKDDPFPKEKPTLQELLAEEIKLQNQKMNRKNGWKKIIVDTVEREVNQ